MKQLFLPYNFPNVILLLAKKLEILDLHLYRF